ncbi:hypothetical protein EYB45_06930 [Erythrobacteraceae bacterium CFH 75059]|uniref:hypothetical protein n=1 Tax=Qipengyuania thermophila TaxID=2509361 RepID=UPI0010205A1E|nr:hypothetical protein [Qipengyuania thermophila]TCD05219.1 hypothetical protein EYB45_06930 [Erythrobacteraceae bacterium CFH 75059]
MEDLSPVVPVALAGDPGRPEVKVTLPEGAALHYAPSETHGRYLALFALNTRLIRLGRTGREPLLTQMKLAWWREQVGDPARLQTAADPLLGLIGRHWVADRQCLVALIDAHEEHWLAEPMHSEAEQVRSALGACFATFATSGRSDAQRIGAAQAGGLWALALLRRSGGSRADAQVLRENLAAMPRLSRALRPAAVLRRIALRALRHERAPLWAGRASALDALRAGLTGR